MNEFKKLRKAAGLSQNDVSKALGFGTPQYISNNERDISTYAFKHVKVLSTLFGVDKREITYLIDDFRSNGFIKKMKREKKQAGL